MVCAKADTHPGAQVFDALGGSVQQGRSQTLCRIPNRPKVNCFTLGTMISTATGEVAIEALKPGDAVLTRDNGPQEVRWIGEKTVSGPMLSLATDLHPVTVQAGALGPGVPSRPLRLSPGHRVLMVGNHPVLDTSEVEVFVSARHLVGTRGIVQTPVNEVTYIHFMCDRHEVVRSDQAWTESFEPTDSALEGVSDRAREEMLVLFPDMMAEDWAFETSGRDTVTPEPRKLA